jgi:hypothetical protein
MSKRKTKAEGAISFSRLGVGQAFRFTTEWDFPYSGMKTGVAVKTSGGGYRYVSDGMECRVGSRNALVVPEKEAQA